MNKLFEHLELTQKAIEYIEENLQEEINVQSIGKRSEMSSWQFQRVFRSLVGDSIGNYLRSRRLTKAARELADTDNRIIDIAINYQFGSQEAFSRAFKAAFKMTPHQFRKEKPKVTLAKKPKLSKETLEHICFGVKREPELRDAPAIHLVGMQTIILSPLSAKLDCFEKLTNHWQIFNEKKKGIPNRVGKKSYGLAMSPSQSMQEEAIIYLAAVEVSTVDTLLEEMVALEVPPSRYAVFENIGLIDKSQATIDYIYGFWLPNSGFERGSGYDFELFDHRYSMDRPDSVSEYWLPLKSQPLK